MSLQEVLVVLGELEHEQVIERYAIGGAVGATFYLEPMATLDVDVFVAFHPEPGELIVSLKPVLDALASRGYAMEREYVMIAGWPVQFLPPGSPLVDEALAEAVTVDVEGVPARVFGAEHLAAIALQTGRAKDKARLLQFLEEEALDESRFHDIIQRHALTDAWTTFEAQFLSDQP